MVTPTFADYVELLFTLFGHCSADSEIDIDRAGDRFSPTGPNLLLLRRVRHVRTG